MDQSDQRVFWLNANEHRTEFRQNGGPSQSANETRAANMAERLEEEVDSRGGEMIQAADLQRGAGRWE